MPHIRNMVKVRPKFYCTSKRKVYLCSGPVDYSIASFGTRKVRAAKGGVLPNGKGPELSGYRLVLQRFRPPDKLACWEKGEKVR